MNNNILCRTFSSTCIGLNAIITTIEISLTQGVGIYLVGLPDSAVRESLLRVTTALQRYNFKIPGKKTVINLAPADLKKEGSSYDAAIAIGLLCASGQCPQVSLSDFIIMGEIALDGKIRKIKGALPIAIKAKEEAYKACIFPKDSAKEAADVDGIDIFAVDNLMEIIEILNGEITAQNLIVKPSSENKTKKHIIENNFEDVKGQEYAKRGLEIAAAGNHNLLMVGPPGSGKSFMAKCLSGILPTMSREEALETSMIYSIAGKTLGMNGLMKERPFRTPHHTSSTVSLVGGGINATPGEISLAHNGVLYLDEMTQYSKTVLDVLRQPLEDRCISISRARYKVDYPASFMLVASMNPCPCGYAGEEDGRCNCSHGSIIQYLSKISGPLIDRIDIHIRVKRVNSTDLVSGIKAESSEKIAERVAKAREIQLERFKNEKGTYTNSQMSARELSLYCKLDDKEKDFLDKLIQKLSLSARAYSRILKISRTIADLDNSENITMKHICEAIQYRFQELY